jgi:iron complex outermembrane receptor protein
MKPIALVVRRAGTLLAGTLAAASLAVPAAARQTTQDLSELSLEDLMQVRVERVFGAAKRVQPTTEAPSSVSIVTAEDIARYGYRTLGEILRSVRGFQISYDRNYSYVGARGFAVPGDYNTRILLLVDGHRMNDDVFDQAGIGRELGLDPTTFQRVEIIRGPASALYGTSAFFAVVSITTKRGVDLNGLSIGAEGGSFGAKRAYGIGGRTFANGLDLAVSGNVEDIDGQQSLFFPEFDAPETNFGVATRLDSETVRGLTGRLGYRDLNVTAAYGRREKQVPTAAFDTVFNDPRFNTLDERAFVDASYEHKWHDTRYALRGYADMYRYDGTYPYAPLTADSDVVISSDYGHGVWWGVDGRATREFRHSHTLTAGLEFRDYARQDQGNLYPDDRAPSFTTDASSQVFATYVQDELRIRNRFLVNVGARYDAYSGFDRVSPRASLVFTATPNRAFKYLFGSAFRAPNAYEFDYLSNGVRNAALRPETINTNEVVWEEYVGGWLRTSVSGYRNNVDRLLTLVSDDEGVLSYSNAGRVIARGLELEAEAKYRAGLHVLVSYSWQKAQDRDTDAELTNSPHHLVKVRVGLAGPVSRSTTAFEVQTSSGRLALTGAEVPGHAIANANYVQPIGVGLSLTATLRNMFDADYADPASEEHVQAAIPQDGRTLLVGVQWNWKRGR